MQAKAKHKSWVEKRMGYGNMDGIMEFGWDSAMYFVTYRGRIW